MPQISSVSLSHVSNPPPPTVGFVKLEIIIERVKQCKWNIHIAQGSAPASGTEEDSWMCFKRLSIFFFKNLVLFAPAQVLHATVSKSAYFPKPWLQVWTCMVHSKNRMVYGTSRTLFLLDLSSHLRLFNVSFPLCICNFTSLPLRGHTCTMWSDHFLLKNKNKNEGNIK